MRSFDDSDETHEDVSRYIKIHSTFPSSEKLNLKSTADIPPRKSNYIRHREKWENIFPFWS